MFGSPNYNLPVSNGYTPWYQQNAPQQQAQQQSNNGIVWVQGEAGAKSFLVAPGQSVLLMDSESNVFYIKSTDASGMPMPLRIFDWTERTVAKNATTAEKQNYVTREEFEKRLAEISNGKSSVPVA